MHKSGDKWYKFGTRQGRIPHYYVIYVDVKCGIELTRS